MINTDKIENKWRKHCNKYDLTSHIKELSSGAIGLYTKPPVSFEYSYSRITIIKDEISLMFSTDELEQYNLFKEFYEELLGEYK